MKSIHRMPTSWRQANSFEYHRQQFIRTCEMEDRFYRRLAKGDRDEIAKVVALTELALSRFDGILNTLPRVPDKNCPIGRWPSTYERELLREYGRRFPPTKSDAVQALQELATIYDTPMLDCGLPQEDEVVVALMNSLQQAKYKVLS